MELVDNRKYIYFYYQKSIYMKVSRVDDGCNKQTSTASSKNGMFQIWMKIVIKN